MNLFTPVQIRWNDLICTGVFSLPNENVKLPDASFLPGAACAWLLCACVLLVLTTLTANLTGMGEQGLGYLSSLNSFLAAAAAGLAAAKRSRAPRLLTAVITGAALVILLLTVGFLTKGEEMDPSSVLSVVSFSCAGVLLGTVLGPKPGRRHSRHSFVRKN